MEYMESEVAGKEPAATVDLQGFDRERNVQTMTGDLLQALDTNLEYEITHYLCSVPSLFIVSF
jgi:hypothetical protein